MGNSADPSGRSPWADVTDTGWVMEFVILAVVIALVAVGVISGLVVSSRKKKQLPPAPSSTPTITPPAEPHVGEEAETPREEPRRTIEEVGPPGAPAEEAPEAVEPEAPAAPALEVPEPTAGRLVRLRARLARSQNSLGKGLLTLLSRDNLDEDTWEEIEDTLLTADVGVAPTQELVERLRERVRVLGTRTPEGCARCCARSSSTCSAPTSTARSRRRAASTPPAS